MKDNRMIFGRYMKRDSWIHRLDARGKIVAMFLFMMAVFMIDSYEQVAFVLAFSLLILLQTRISLVSYIRAIKPLLFLVLFILLFHLLVDSSGARLLDLGPVAIYSGGMARGVIAAARMTLFITFAAMLTFTTEPDRLTNALGHLLAPLRVIRFKPDKLVLMLNVALRFIPTIFDEAHRLYKAQVSRGLHLADKSLPQKARLLIALLVPVTAGVFRRAVRLAESMEARGYVLGAPRTVYRTTYWRAADTVFLMLCLLPVIGVLYL